MSPNQAEIRKLMQEVLGESHLHLQVQRVTVEENLSDEVTKVSCEVVEERSGQASIVAGEGVGVIDALFNGMLGRFADEYSSLKTIRFNSFSLNAHLDTKQGFSGSDSTAEVTIEIANSADKIFTFAGASRSLTTAAILTAINALEYFINSERAFVAMHNALKDAKERRRPDLVQRFTNVMATLVQNTSYSEVIEKIQHEDLD